MKMGLAKPVGKVDAGRTMVSLPYRISRGGTNIQALLRRGEGGPFLSLGNGREKMMSSADEALPERLRAKLVEMRRPPALITGEVLLPESGGLEIPPIELVQISEGLQMAKTLLDYDVYRVLLDLNDASQRRRELFRPCLQGVKYGSPEVIETYRGGGSIIVGIRSSWANEIRWAYNQLTGDSLVFPTRDELVEAMESGRIEVGVDRSGEEIGQWTDDSVANGCYYYFLESNLGNYAFDGSEVPLEWMGVRFARRTPH